MSGKGITRLFNATKRLFGKGEICAEHKAIFNEGKTLVVNYKSEFFFEDAKKVVEEIGGTPCNKTVKDFYKKDYITASVFSVDLLKNVIDYLKARGEYSVMVVLPHSPDFPITFVCCDYEIAVAPFIEGHNESTMAEEYIEIHNMELPAFRIKGDKD